MRTHLGSLLLGGLLVAGGFALAQTPSWLRPAQAGAAGWTNGYMVTSDDAAPGRIYVWDLAGPELTSVTVHDCDRVAGTVVSRRVEPAPAAGHGGGR
jgi:hypothetical protein